VTVTRSALPWARFIGGDCACTREAPCLLHYDDLGWRDRMAALTRAGIRPAAGR
jgi:hypothetical protein